MDSFNYTLLFIVIGMLLLGIGYHRRASDLGMGIMWAGAMCMLSMMFYAIFQAIGI